MASIQTKTIYKALEDVKNATGEKSLYGLGHNIIHVSKWSHDGKTSYCVCTTKLTIWFDSYDTTESGCIKTYDSTGHLSTILN